MNVTVDKRNNAATIDTSLQMARDRLMKAVKEGASGTVVVKVTFRKGGVRSLTVGDEMVVEPVGGNKQQKPDP